MKPVIIAINAVSGGGKTALAKLLAASLPRSTLFCFDDFDETNIYPPDYSEWAKRGADILEFDCHGMASAVEKVIQSGMAKFIVMDYPFGREHPRLKKQIDLAVYIDTPLDVAMARRILRDTAAEIELTAEQKLANLRCEMTHYVDKARQAYLVTNRHEDGSDLVLDGCQSLECLREQILAHLNKLRSQLKSRKLPNSGSKSRR